MKTTGSLACGAGWKVACYQLGERIQEDPEIKKRFKKKGDNEFILVMMSLKCLWGSHVKISIW